MNNNTGDFAYTLADISVIKSDMYDLIRRAYNAIELKIENTWLHHEVSEKSNLITVNQKTNLIRGNNNIPLESDLQEHEQSFQTLIQNPLNFFQEINEMREFVGEKNVKRKLCLGLIWYWPWSGLVSLTVGGYSGRILELYSRVLRC